MAVECLSPNRTSIPPPQGSGNMEEEAEGMKELQDGGCAAKKYILDMTSLLQIHHSCGYLYKMEPITIPFHHQRGRCSEDGHPTCGTIDSPWLLGRNAILFSGVATDKLTVCQ